MIDSIKISYRVFLLCILIEGLSACALHKPVSELHPDFEKKKPGLIAVLPMDNMSVDLDATPLLRPIVAQRLSYKGYNCLPLEQVDRLLKENGVMVSHDVYMFTSEELGKILGVDALVYGIVTDFTKHYAFFYSDIIVGLSLQMVDARTGEVLWKDERTSSENTILNSLLIAGSLEKPEDRLVAVLAYNAAFALLSQYRPYAESAVRGALSSLPEGPYGERFYPWDIDNAVWEGDIVDLWLKSTPSIPAYSPRLKKK